MFLTFLGWIQTHVHTFDSFSSFMVGYRHIHGSFQDRSTGCTTVNGIKENDISQLVDPVERYTIWQMKVNEFHFMSV